VIPVRIVAGFDWPAWLTAIGTIFLAGGVFFAARQLQEQRIQRLSEAAAVISLRWDADDMIASRQESKQYNSEAELCDAVRRGMEGDPEIKIDLMLREPNFFDDLGLDEIQGGITLQWLEASMGQIIVDRWKLWSSAVTVIRDIDPAPPPAYANFEALAKRLSGQRLTIGKASRRRLSLWLIRTLPY